MAKGGLAIKKETRRKWINKLKLWGKLILNWRFLVCFGIAWMITNGWSYALYGLGALFDNRVMKWIATSYLAFLWFPYTPEKVVTFAIGFFLVRRLFPNHYQSLRTQIEEAQGKRSSSSARSGDSPEQITDDSHTSE